MSFDFEKIRVADIENMLYLIMAHAGSREAKRFNNLTLIKKQKVTLILKNRARRARKADQPIDFFIVREVIDDALKGVFIFD
jgi:hypothetical protein